jgi:hypothetical protein
VLPSIVEDLMAFVAGHSARSAHSILAKKATGHTSKGVLLNEGGAGRSERAALTPTRAQCAKLLSPDLLLPIEGRKHREEYAGPRQPDSTTIA